MERGGGGVEEGGDDAKRRGLAMGTRTGCGIVKGLDAHALHGQAETQEVGRDDGERLGARAVVAAGVIDGEELAVAHAKAAGGTHGGAGDERRVAMARVVKGDEELSTQREDKDGALAVGCAASIERGATIVDETSAND